MKSEKWYKVMRSPEYREKQRKISLRNSNKPPVMWGNKVNLGRKHTEEWKKKHGEQMKKLGVRPPIHYGEKHPCWKGGTSSKYRATHAPRPKPEQCEICGSIGNIFCDHDHKTGKFRGWICVRCNTILGMAKDNTETLNAIIDYIRLNSSL